MTLRARTTPGCRRRRHRWRGRHPPSCRRRATISGRSPAPGRSASAAPPIRAGAASQAPRPRPPSPLYCPHQPRREAYTNWTPSLSMPLPLPGWGRGEFHTIALGEVRTLNDVQSRRAGKGAQRRRGGRLICCDLVTMDADAMGRSHGRVAAGQTGRGTSGSPQCARPLGCIRRSTTWRRSFRPKGFWSTVNAPCDTASVLSSGVA